jgi:hypothetical protein
MRKGRDHQERYYIFNTPLIQWLLYEPTNWAAYSTRRIVVMVVLSRTFLLRSSTRRLIELAEIFKMFKLMPLAFQPPSPVVKEQTSY